MTTTFDVAVKSTIDKVLSDLAMASGWIFFDLDGAYLTPDIGESKAPAIVVSFPGITPNPRDPYYAVVFEAGARTSDDPAQYIAKTILGTISEVLDIHKGIPVYDYSGAVAGDVKLGELIPISRIPTPSRFDQISGLNMYQLVALCQRFV
ncbi:hypothetical protein [Methylovulum miyakonense]|uniref:hypothetical protein n=1 Tax=Methylovulum miyakonense TaxID=645578 RepID=UPI0003717978|nr:hypothetical protein [Methylovulum miyakonense]